MTHWKQNKMFFVNTFSSAVVFLPSDFTSFSFCSVKVGVTVLDLFRLLIEFACYSPLSDQRPIPAIDVKCSFLNCFFVRCADVKKEKQMSIKIRKA